MNKHWTFASRPVSALLLLALLLALSAGIASAHETTVIQSTPADGATIAESPSQVTAQFSEELDTQGSTMVVLDAARHQVSDGPGRVDLNDPDHATMIATLPSALADGVYTVNWHAVLTDGDASDGSFTFTVQTADNGAMVEVTASPSVAPGVTTTVTPAPTAAPTALPTAAPTADPAMAAPAATDAATSAPGQLPATGSTANRTALWSATAIGGMLLVFGLSAALRRSRR